MYKVERKRNTVHFTKTSYELYASYNYKRRLDIGLTYYVDADKILN